MLLAQAWWYRPMFAFERMSAKLGESGALVLVISAWVLYSSVREALPPDAEAARQLLTIGWFGVCGYTWFAGSITRSILRRRYPWME
jgi:hypothetical protein